MFHKINSYLRTIEAGIAATSLLLLLALSIFQILLRNAFDFGYPEIDIINRHLLVFSGMMGAVLATTRGAHIKTDALNILLPATIRHKLKIPLKLFASIVCLLLCYYATTFVSDEWQYAPANERWTLPFTLIYPLSFALMSWHFIIDELFGFNQNDH